MSKSSEALWETMLNQLSIAGRLSKAGKELVGDSGYCYPRMIEIHMQTLVQAERERCIALIDGHVTFKGACYEQMLKNLNMAPQEDKTADVQPQPKSIKPSSGEPSGAALAAWKTIRRKLVDNGHEVPRDERETNEWYAQFINEFMQPQPDECGPSETEVQRLDRRIDNVATIARRSREEISDKLNNVRDQLCNRIDNLKEHIDSVSAHGIDSRIELRDRLAKLEDKPAEGGEKITCVAANRELWLNSCAGTDKSERVCRQRLLNAAAILRDAGVLNDA